jgi:hypothetical protein
MDITESEKSTKELVLEELASIFDITDGNFEGSSYYSTLFSENNLPDSQFFINEEETQELSSLLSKLGIMPDSVIRLNPSMVISRGVLGEDSAYVREIENNNSINK